jgi:predicted unusual protein kinase regulating ubiquinone biosynthesis (AarF/ABC1/UbiB family)
MSDNDSRLSRLVRLGGMGGRIGARYVSERLKGVVSEASDDRRVRDRMHIDSAREIADTVGRMRGAALKLGQQIAVAAAALDLPPEARAALSTLHKDAEPVPFEQIRADIEGELAGPLDAYFAHLDPIPIGTASLGQVHRATLFDGTDVVVKVLHRGVRENVETDLLALKAMLASGRVLRRGRAELDATFDEIKARLYEELDYLQEAANIQGFYDRFGADPDLRMPRLHHALCTERILTMDRLPGVHMGAFLKTASPEAKQRAGRTLLTLYHRMVFEHGVLHADPHPGNYLFEPDGRVGLIDFGCVKRFNEFFLGAYGRTALSAHAQDREGTLQGCMDLGAWDGTDPAVGDLMWRFCDGMMAGFRGGEQELGANHEHLVEDVKPIVKEYIRTPGAKIPTDAIFLHRSLGGLYTMVRALELKTDFGAVFQPYAELAVARAEGRA